MASTPLPPSPPTPPSLCPNQTVGLNASLPLLCSPPSPPLPSPSEHLLYLYSRFDLLLLILNLTIIILPLGKYLLLYLLTRLPSIPCISKQISAWKSSVSGPGTPTSSSPSYSLHYHQPKLTFATPSSPLKGKSLKSVTLNEHLQNSRETEPLTFGTGKTASSSAKRCLVRAKKLSPSTFGLRARLGELLSQTFYIILFLLYLAYTLELTILCFTQGSVNPDDSIGTSSLNIIPLELATGTLTLLIHLIEYGLIYGPYLWLSSTVSPRLASGSSRSQRSQYKFVYTVNSFAFVYSAVQSLVSIAKLSLTILLFAPTTTLLLRLLKTYLLSGMIALQLYFTGKHLLQLIEIKCCQLKRTSESSSSGKANTVKYRRSQSTFLSMVTFTWFLDILRLGYRKNLDQSDLGSLPSVEQASSQYERFYVHYRAVDIIKHKSSFLWRVCWRTYQKSLIFGAIVKIASDLSSLIGPISIGFILTYISNAQNSRNSATSTANDVAIEVTSETLRMEYLAVGQFFANAYVMTIVVLISTFLQSTLSNNFNHLVISEGIHLKTALNCCIYNKALRMPITNSGIDIGIISNYMSTDCSNIFQFFTMMHYLWSVPIKIVVLLYLLYQQMGVSALIGASVFFILSPFQYYCSRKISQIQKLQMDASDRRLSKTTELFMGIKLLKLLGWDLHFSEHIKRLRETELKYLQKDAVFVAINTFITQGSAILVTMLTFTLFPYLEAKPLTSATVFTSIALFNQITTPLYIVPLVIPMLVSAVVSHRRLVDYLSIPDLKTDFIQWEDGPLRQRDIAPNSAPILATNQHRALDRSASAHTNRPSAQSTIMNDLCCYTKHGKFAWYDEAYLETTLSDINLTLPRGKLTIVVGSIGSGKSTFLASLLGETYLAGGELHWLHENCGGFGYVPSDPWILNVSLQENITFGRAYDRKRYEEVVSACCLQAEIDLLPNGDQTTIGERGINLSGGQKQRIALARAIYSNTATLILDDALSALDPIVGYSVFDNAIKRLVIRQQGRTVVLATHRHEFLSNAHYVVVIESGTIRHQGTLMQIEREDKAFYFQWNVIKERELRERLGQKPRNCKTTEERSKLVRLVSKKSEFRGPWKAVKRDPSLNRFKRKAKALSRQMSCDASNALPCHDWGDCEDIIQESESENDGASSMGAVCNLNRLVSLESANSKHSYLSLSSSPSAIFADTNLGSVTSNATQVGVSASSSSTRVKPPAVLRLNSRISNYSVPGASIIEEEEDDSTALLCCRHNMSKEDCGCSMSKAPTVKSEPEDEGGDNSDRESTQSSDYSSPVEDNTQEVNNELLYEIITYNENQVETGTLYNVDINPQNNQISLTVYLSYLKAHSYTLGGLVFALIILNQAVKVVSDFWLAKWTDKDERKAMAHAVSANSSSISSLSSDEDGMQYYLYTYTLLSLIAVVISLITNVAAQLIAIRAVRLLHDNLIHTLVRCSLRFFDKTPIGRIMNRFTNDINVIDKKLPIAIPVLLRFFFLCLSAIIVNIIITPYFLLAVIPILVVYYYLQNFFRTTSRQLQRLELSSKAPIISHFNQTIDGLTTIRAFHEEAMFTDKFTQLLDINNLCFLMVNSANCCLGILLDYLGGVILFLATLISITAALYWNVQSAFVGLAMSYTLLVPVYLNWLVRNLASVEMNMSSVERIYRYTNMEIEDSCLNALKESDRGIPAEWPQRGDIQFHGVSIRYETNFEPIIKNASIHIRAGEKVGICGRTGSGKSSLIGALFRINQICKGSILIDNIDITTVCPYKLRKKLSIIPQDLVLFSGSVRTNLDPGNRHSDEEIWTILKDFQLDRSITSLDEEINDETSFSSGARQLLCCARAFLRSSPVLIMDESTSLLDSTSESLVMQSIFRSQKTIIAIAHRITNIANFDKVLVVNEGRIAEFDTPENLLRQPGSIFYSLYHKQSSR